ncbi:hypothetical protein [Effusibacillus pohliae]|uniref:hypothetical protein n=1 Tax=Effusibacillus pohliae TaxID=232270 RepID=UPI00035D6CD6|nr:hypothetical protein [Effusibacillus pohliae]
MNQWKIVFENGRQFVEATGMAEAWTKGNQLRKSQPELGRIILVAPAQPALD